MDWWQGLLGVVVGGLLAGGFGWFTQQRADAQAAAKQKRDREQAAAKDQRDREHEQHVWARQLRYKTHVQFLQEFERLHYLARSHALARLSGEKPELEES